MKYINRILTFFALILSSVFNMEAIQNTRLFNDKEVISSNYSSFCLDKDGYLWIGTQYGLLRFDGTNFDKYLHDENSETSLSDNRILKILRDKDDRMWIATCEGLNLYEPNTDSFRRITLPTLDLYGYIMDICQISNGDIIFMVSGVGLYIIDFSSGEPVAVKFMPQIEETKTINTLQYTPKSELICGNHAGEIIKISSNGQSNKFKLSDSYIKILLRDQEDNIFIASTEKAWKWDLKTDTFTPIKISDGHKPVLNCAELTVNGDILVGSIGCGVFRLEKNSTELKPYHELNNPLININSARISTIHEDPLGNLWLGSSHQGIIMSPKREIPFNYVNIARAVKDYSGGETNIAMFPDSDDIWVGLDNGLLISINEYGHLLSRHQFGGGISALLASKSGKLYLGVDNHGLYELDPASGATIYLNGKKINNTSLTSSGEKVLPMGSTDPSKIRLSFRDNSLMLRMSTKNFWDTDNLVFQWRIPDIVNNWVSTTPGSGIIALPHLQSGSYRLEVRATENGLFSDIKTVTISVSSPWYLSPVAKILYLLLLCALFFLAWRAMKHKNSERVNEEKIKFFINISHEIRSPLTLILSPLERIMKKEHDLETTKNLNAIHRNANRILGLINQLLDIRKIDKGKMKIRCSETEFISFTRELVEIFKPQAEEKGLSLEFVTKDPSLTNLTVWIDRNNFDKVLVNLISNAIKYTPSGGDIQVSVSQCVAQELGGVECVEIQVLDTGIGLNEKNIDRLFDRFYQGKFNHGDIPLGFGIGLDLCRQLVELHNGVITAANRTDCKGSCFTVRIPVRCTSADETVAEETQSPVNDRKIAPSVTQIPHSEAKRNSKNSSLRILVVDDDAEIRSFLKDILSGFGKVTEATNGEEAMRCVMEKTPDLIISDVVMPCMDGLTLLKTLKSNVDTNHIPVILLSSKNDVSDRMAGWDKGADGYIGKPFIVEELQAMVDNLIDNRLRLKGKFSGTQQQDGKIEAPELKGNDKMLIDKIVNQINDHLEDPNLNVEKLCQEVGLSRAHLNRKMKELFGLTPSEFIRNVRLRKACELLRQPDVDISQIAYSVGFSSQSHFSTAFKRFTGISPTEYRQKKSDEAPQMTEE